MTNPQEGVPPESPLARFWKGIRGARAANAPVATPSAPQPLALDRLEAEAAALGGKHRLLLCAEEAHRRAAVEEILAPSAHKWSLLPTSKSGAELLDLIRKHGIQGVILDCRSATGGPIESLQTLAKELPDLPRFAVCGNAARDAVRRLPGMPPVIIRDDATAEDLDQQISEAFMIQGWLMRPAVRDLLPLMVRLPVMPSNYQRIFSMLLNPDFSGDEVARLVAEDPPLTAQTLKVVNSAFFGLSHPVKTTQEAVMILGALRMRALVISANGVSFIDEGVCPGYSPRQEWEHALAVACEAQKLAGALGMRGPLGDSAFTAGVLHDLGKLMLAANMQAEYGALLEEQQSTQAPLWRLEQDRLGVTHAELGACLLGLWGLPPTLVEAVAFHHLPDRAPNQTPGLVTLIHLADARRRGYPPDRRYLEAIGLPDAVNLPPV